MQDLKLAIFDVAGTVIEDHGEVVDSLVDSLASHGIRVTSDELAEHKGAAKRDVIRYFAWRKLDRQLTPGEVEPIYIDFEHIVNKRYELSLAPIEGAEDCFESLQKRGMRLALTTGFGRSTLDLIVRRLGWQEFFSATVASDEVASGRPAPYLIFRAMEMSRCGSVLEVLNVGDTPLDLLSARNAGVALNVGVLTGHHSRERLITEPHHALLANVGDLPTLLAQQEQL